MKANATQPVNVRQPSNRVIALLIVLCIVCGALAAIFGQKKSELQRELDKVQRLQGNRAATAGRIQRGQGGSDGGGESEQVFKMVNQLAQKEAAISELRQRLIAIQEGKVPDAKLSQNTLPKSVRSSRPAKAPARTPAPVTQRTVVRTPQPVPAPVYNNLPEQESFIQSIDVTTMPVNEQENHAELLKHLDSLRLIVDALNRNGGSDPTGELRNSLSREERNINTLMRAERLALFSNVGRELGYDDESSLLFAEHIDRIGTMTTFEPAQHPVAPPAPPEPAASEEPDSAE
ncbi:MAG: hypothetical protein WCL44_06035 [bacterium]